MTITITIEVDTSGITHWLDSLYEATPVVVKAAAEDIAVGAKGWVAKDTESLADTIDVEEMVHIRDRPSYSVNAGDISSGFKGGGRFDSKAGGPVDYAIEQEYGPGEHTPYMTPAAEAGWESFQTMMMMMLRAISGGG